MLAVKLFHDEVHLLVPGDVFGEEHAGPGRKGFPGDHPGDHPPGRLQRGHPLFQQHRLGLEFPELLLDQVGLLPEEVEGVVHRLALQIGLDLLHGEVQPPEIPDHVQLVHLLQGVEAVAIGIPPGL